MKRYCHPSIFILFTVIISLFLERYYTFDFRYFFYFIILLVAIFTLSSLKFKYWQKIVFQFIFLIILFFIYFSLIDGFNPKYEIFDKYFLNKIGFFKNIKYFNFLKSIILGDRTYLSRDYKKIFSLTGSYHFIAISGLHFGILASILSVIFKYFKKEMKNIFIIVFLFIYLIMINFYVSAFRAFIMISLYLIAKILNKKSYPLNIWAFTTIFLLVLNKTYFNNLGFWLSVIATLSILLILENLSVFNHKLIKIFVISLNVQLFLLPIILYYFNHINIMSPILNVFGVFFLYPIIIIGVILIFPLPHYFTRLFVRIVEKLIFLFVSYIEYFKKEIFIIRCEEFFVWMIILYYLFFIPLFFYIKNIFKKRKR